MNYLCEGHSDRIVFLLAYLKEIFCVNKRVNLQQYKMLNIFKFKFGIKFLNRKVELPALDFRD